MQYRTDVHYWPKTKHPLLGGGSTLAGLDREVAQARSRGRIVDLVDLDEHTIKVTVYIPQ